MPGLSFLYGFDNVKSVLSALISRHSNGAALLGRDCNREEDAGYPYFHLARANKYLDLHLESK